MAQICEVCGDVVHGSLVLSEIDNAVFRVCIQCAKLGRHAQLPPQSLRPAPPLTRRSSPPPTLEEPVLQLRRDYNSEIKKAREKLGLSQEELGARINEKPSVVRLLESGKLKPSDPLARKVEHFLRIQLFEALEEE